MDLRKVFENVSKKSYFGAVLFAVALWFYTSLSSEYTTLVNMPLIIQLPEDRAFEEPPPSNVLIEAKGNGWNLFNLLFFNNSKKVYIDLKNSRITESEHEIGRNTILKGVQSFERVELSDVLNEKIILKTGRVTSYVVPVEPNLKIIPTDGFFLVGKPVLEPNEIEIRGNEKIVKNIKSWFTKNTVIENKNAPFTEKLELSDSLNGIVKLNLNSIKFSADIQQTAEITFDELRISIRGGIIPNNFKLYPTFISVTFRGGINDIMNLNPDKISVHLNYADIVNDKTGILIPKIDFPGNLKIIQTFPKYIHNHKVVETNSLSKLN
jgi:hypothetical protein